MQRNDITLVASLKNYHIPYGVCEIGERAAWREYREARVNFLVNTGMYVLEASALDLVPKARSSTSRT